MAAARTLTVRTIQSAKRDAAKAESFIWDSTLPGFGMRIRNGRRSFVYQYRRPDSNRSARLKVGPVLEDDVAGSLAIARKAALQAQQKVANGVDPMAEKRARREAVRAAEEAATVAEAWVAYIADRKPHLAPGSLAKYESAGRHHILPRLGSCAIASVTREDVRGVINATRKLRTIATLPRKGRVSEEPPTPINLGGNVAGNRVLAILTAFFNWASLHGYVDEHAANPTKGIAHVREVKRQRFLSLEEIGLLAAVLRECDAERRAFMKRPAAKEGRFIPGGAPGVLTQAVAFFELLLFTGARAGEIQNLRWERVHFDTGVIFIEQPKERAPKTLAMTPPVRDVLERLARDRELGNPWVIPAGEKPPKGRIAPLGPLQGTFHIWNRVRARAGLNDVRLHDLRHSFASVLAAQGYSLHQIGAVLGHKRAATTARYAHLANAAIAEVSESAANAIAAAINAPSTVVPFDRANRRKGP